MEPDDPLDEARRIARLYPVCLKCGATDRSRIYAGDEIERLTRGEGWRCPACGGTDFGGVNIEFRPEDKEDEFRRQARQDNR